MAIADERFALTKVELPLLGANGFPNGCGGLALGAWERKC